VAVWHVPEWRCPTIGGRKPHVGDGGVFPGGREGKITIDYQSSGPDWTLAVNDDGFGMRSEPAGTTPGLGISIIEALAKQLHARVQVADARPGTAVSIMRTSLAEPVIQAI
jgi:two-component sensor histidine kinase